MKTDHEGRDIPPGETRDTVINVWSISPHMQDRDFDCCLIRSWQEMLSFVESNLDSHLERYSTDELQEGVTIRFQLIQMTLGQYEDIQNGVET